MMTHIGQLDAFCYEFINSGIKTNQMYALDDAKRETNVGDIWIFKCTENTMLPELKTKIIDITMYDSFFVLCYQKCC